MNEIRRKNIAIGGGESLQIVEIAGGSGAPSGPAVSIIGGVHGDEEEGVLAVRRLEQLLGERDIEGTVRLLPVANPPAYRARTRLSPVDNKNLARVFPGNPDGSSTERAAQVITSELIDGADAMIDLHSAGVNNAALLFCGYFELGTSYSRESARIARAFGTPVVWAHTQVTEGRTISAALELGVPAIYAECGGGGEVRASDAAAYVNGTINVLATLGVLKAEPSRNAELSLITDSGGDTDDGIVSPESGTMITHVAAGDLVKRGDLLCEVCDERGRVVAALRSRCDGIAVFVRRKARIEKGQMIAVIASRPEQWSI